jgi:hypothetical protein
MCVRLILSNAGRESAGPLQGVHVPSASCGVLPGPGVGGQAHQYPVCCCGAIVNMWRCGSDQLYTSFLKCQVQSFVAVAVAVVVGICC